MDTQMSLFETDPTPSARPTPYFAPDRIKRPAAYVDTGRRVEVRGASPGAARAEARPAVARHTDPLTSHEAAASVDVFVISDLHRAILAVFRAAGVPMNDEDLRDRYDAARAGGKNYPRASLSGLRSRRAELRDNGYLRDSGETKPSAAGRKSVLWELVPGDLSAAGESERFAAPTDPDPERTETR